MKPKGLLVFITLILFAFGCSQKNNNNQNKNELSFFPAYKSLEVNKDFIHLLDKFIEETSPNASIYLVVVDKALDKIVVTLIANNFSSEYLNQFNPLFYFIRENKNVYIVNGFESFFKPEYNKFSSLKSEKYFKMISYLFEDNKIITYDRGIIPFATPPVELDSIK